MVCQACKACQVTAAVTVSPGRQDPQGSRDAWALMESAAGTDPRATPAPVDVRDWTDFPERRERGETLAGPDLPE